MSELGVFGLGFTLGAWLMLISLAPRLVSLTAAMNDQKETMNKHVDAINEWLKVFRAMEIPNE